MRGTMAVVETRNGKALCRRSVTAENSETLKATMNDSGGLYSTDASDHLSSNFETEARKALVAMIKG